MSTSLVFILITITILIFYAWYAIIIGKRNKALEALSTIDIQLRQRLDLIPNILKIANKFMKHESSLLGEITALRTKADKTYDKREINSVSEHLEAAEKLSAKMGQFMVSVENYPDLKSDKTMVQAMQTYNEVEAQISAARRFYNAATAALNNSVQIFPGNVIANLAGVKEMPFFKTDDEAKAPIDAENFLR